MRKKTTKSEMKLEPWQKADAARLAELFKRATMSQEKFGDEFGIGTQGAVSQYLNGLIPLNLPAALRFAKGLGVSVSDFSPTLGKSLEGLADPHVTTLSGALQLMSDTDRKDVLNYFQYKVENSDGTKEMRRHYAGLIKQLREQLSLPLGDSAANEPAHSQPFRAIKGRKP